MGWLQAVINFFVALFGGGNKPPAVNPAPTPVPAPTPAPPPSPVPITYLRNGSTGPSVVSLQNVLIGLGYLAQGDADGNFGPVTQAAVEKFQVDQGLVSDGIVGPKTLNALLAAQKNPPTPTPTPSPATLLYGIDVADGQQNTNWVEVQNAGISFAYIKATEGNTYVNPIYAGDMRNALATKVLPGPYHFYRPQDDGLTQANHFLNTVGPVFKGMLRPMFDWEVIDGVDVETAKARALAFLQRVEQVMGVKAIIYYSADFFDTFGDMSAFKDYLAWPAELGVSHPQMRSVWKTPTIWQNSWTGNVHGINGAVDTDIFYGDQQQLQALVIK